ncbi:IS481 family transposase [Salinibacterium sp. NG253]|nr:IS481 family transposase [Salinibacterium sp. NG253]
MTAVGLCAARYRSNQPTIDGSSRPYTFPNRWSARLEHHIVALRFNRRRGPHRIGYHLGINRSTVEKVLVRYRMPKLIYLDQATGLPVRRLKAVRYEKATPGELVHVDIREQGRIPDGGGHRVLGRAAGNRNNTGHGRPGRGYSCLHSAVDDHSRLAYSELLSDESKETAAEFWLRANAFFAAASITVTAVMTDSGACYRSRNFAAALSSIKHVWMPPYRPQTSGKVERFNRTLATEWADAATYRSDEARAAEYPTWLHHYNFHRPHTGIGGQTPSDRVHNLSGNYN